MGFDIKLLKTPKYAKFVTLACIFVVLVIFLANTRPSDYIWADEHVSESSNTKDIKTLGSGDATARDTPNMNFTEKRQMMLNNANIMFDSIKLNTTMTNKDVDEMVLLLTEDQTSCFKIYGLDIQTLSNDPLTPLESLDAKRESGFYMLSSFNKLIASLNMKASIIEPSILHCMLETNYKQLLTKRNFNVSIFVGSSKIITYGIIGDEVAFLQKEENICKFRNMGFQTYFVQVPLASWMRENNTRRQSEKYTSHIFYTYYKWTIHVVVFHKRNSYLWHAALDSNDRLNIPSKKDLLFVNYDSAYENFEFVPLVTNSTNPSSIYIPSSPHYFLFQIPSSHFLECNLSRAANVKASTDSPNSHSSLSVDNFNSRTLAALQELKILFNDLLMNFWIFSGTMLGWYRQCDVIPYTTDVDFGAWASEIEDLDYLIKYFQKNKNLTIVERMGVLEEALEFQLRYDGLRVDVFFMYKIHNGSWASGHRPSKGYYFRYHYPPFTLCSAELLNQKVQVPCETEDVIVTEYGSNWMNPVSSWNYESSIKNRGPDIYWDEKRRPKAFQEY